MRGSILFLIVLVFAVGGVLAGQDGKIQDGPDGFVVPPTTKVFKIPNGTAAIIAGPCTQSQNDYCSGRCLEQKGPYDLLADVQCNITDDPMGRPDCTCRVIELQVESQEAEPEPPMEV